MPKSKSKPSVSVVLEIPQSLLASAVTGPVCICSACAPKHLDRFFSKHYDTTFSEAMLEHLRISVEAAR